MKSDRRISVMFDCNRRQNGSFRGYCDQVRMNDSVDFEIRTHVDIRDHAIRFGWRVFPITSRKRWVGNWCWDEVTMDNETAHKLFHYLALLEATITAAPSKVWDAYHWLRDQGAVTV